MKQNAEILPSNEVGIAKQTLCEANAAPMIAVSRPVRMTRAANDEALIASWLGTYHPVNSARTLVLYRQIVKGFVSWMAERELRLTTLAVEDLTAWRDQLGGAISTQANRLAAVKGLLGYAHRTGYAPYNVGVAVRGPKVDVQEGRALTEGEVATLLRAAREQLEAEEARSMPRPRYLRAARTQLCLVEFLYVSATRVSEATRVTWNDFERRPDGDFDLHILGKGRKRRRVPVPASAVEHLTQHLGRCTKDEAEPVFDFGPRRAQTLIRKLALRAGIRGRVSPHSLRHAAASHSLNRGCPVHTVRHTLGHASLATTTRYCHNTRQDGVSRYLKVM